MEFIFEKHKLTCNIFFGGENLNCGDPNNTKKKEKRKKKVVRHIERIFLEKMVWNRHISWNSFLGEIARFRQLVPACHQNIVGFLNSTFLFDMWPNMATIYLWMIVQPTTPQNWKRKTLELRWLGICKSLLKSSPKVKSN